MSTTFYRGENPLHADKLNTAFSERVSRGGDTMQGFLTLAADPVQPFDAATKQYVDRFTAMGVPTGAYIGASPPGNTLAPLWWDNVSGQLFIQYNDGSSTQWVSTNSTYSTQLPLAGGVMTGPLYWTATGALTSRSAQDRSVPYSVMDFGAVMNGTTSDQTPLTNAFVATPALGVIRIPSGNINPGTFAPTSKPMLWQCAGTYTGSGTLTLAALGNGVVETMYGTWSKWFNRGSSIGITNMGAVVRVDMTLNHAGGTSGGVAALDVNAYTTAGSTLSEAPLAISGRLTLSRTAAAGQVGTAVFGAAVKASGAGNASPFGGNFLADDQTGLSSVNGGSAVGAEIDLKANKLDDGTTADGFNAGTGTYAGSNRVVLALQYGRSNRSDNTPMEVSTILQMGYFLTSIDGPYCSAKNAIKVQGTISFAGLNFLHATFNAGAQAIALQTEQSIGWTTDPTTVTPTHWNCLQYRAATSRLYYTVNGVDQWSVDASGNVRARGTITGSTTP